jgi:UDP-N-acetylglucosamine 2-epimerase (non-hydrolysing)
MVSPVLRKQHILIVFGTRPEAIKMVPVVQALKAQPGIRATLCVTVQHRKMLDQVLSIAGLTPDIDLDLMLPNQSLGDLLARMVTAVGMVLDRERPDRVLVHGDTMTAFATALSAYYRRIPIAHVEAGLRTGDADNPWPEEANRRAIAAMADLHFAPTDLAARALMQEGVDVASIHVTSNTVVDALQATRAALTADAQLASDLEALAGRFAGKHVVLATAHRRENFGMAMHRIGAALARLAHRTDLVLVCPLHANPNVRPVLAAHLAGRANAIILDPLDYPSFVSLLSMSTLILTDSGGIQEEAPAFGKPVLVLRHTTERPEGLEAGTAKLVGTDTDRIVAEASALLDDPARYSAMARAHNPFGDGRAAERIAAILAAEAKF